MMCDLNIVVTKRQWEQAQKVCLLSGYVCGAGQFWRMLVSGLWCMAWCTHILFDFPFVEVVPTQWGTPSQSPFLSGVFLVASVFVGMSVCPPKLEYLAVMQMLSLLKDLGMHLSLQEIFYQEAVPGFTGQVSQAEDFTLLPQFRNYSNLAQISCYKIPSLHDEILNETL